MRVQFYGIPENEKVIEWVEENVPGSEWIVTDEDGRYELVREEIREMAWSFYPSFIIGHSKVDISEEILNSIISEQCERANDFVLSIIEDFDEFVEDAIRADGYGHFLNRYDGEEYELEVDGVTYYIYALT